MTSAKPPTIKELVLASLLIHGPATYRELVGRLTTSNHHSIRRELTDMVRRVDVVALPMHNTASGRRYRHPKTDPIKASVIQSSHHEVETPTQPVEFGESIPAYALRWDPEHQRLWRHGL